MAIKGRLQTEIFTKYCPTIFTILSPTAANPERLFKLDSDVNSTHGVFCLKTVLRQYRCLFLGPLTCLDLVLSLRG